MAVLKINGVNILNYTSGISTSEVGEQHPAFPNRIKGVISNTQKIVTGWELPNDGGYSTNPNYDASKGKIKVNGTAYKVMIDGTRPRNISMKASFEGTGLTYYLNNRNGKLYLSTTVNSSSGTFIIESKATNKDCVVALACWGAGGKGGGGAYWFLAGNWGGVGGAGGGKVLLNVCVKNNSYLKFVTDTDDEWTGRLNNSNDDCFPSPGFRLYNSNGTQLLRCSGGYSGISNHPRWHQDEYVGAGVYTIVNKGYIPGLLRSAGRGGAKIGNGLYGNPSVYNEQFTEYPLANVERNIGAFSMVGIGGSTLDEQYTQSHGSGGGASYGNGGNGGDTGSGSNGSRGWQGGGGGGSGSPAGGANGGDGGPPGCIIFY